MDYLYEETSKTFKEAEIFLPLIPVKSHKKIAFILLLFSFLFTILFKLTKYKETAKKIYKAKLIIYALASCIFFGFSAIYLICAIGIYA
ncbi:hypothetical protein MERGE_001009 [Pneumocystis wakefieldiae]|uniref:Dolichyl-diphosphooligosaccharide-protein glycosyltransferase subunit OST5 n=1 Tax=Pneumocystis wakefieldiae TaxID=38082 RepID=A0A899G174_9ASCO|nr:hypothetical protein MERGE_001009 [Pneumocystis wakefieldiae]